MRLRRLASIALSLALLCPVTAASAYTLREQSQLVEDGHGVSSIRVDNPRGLIQVHPSPDGRLHVTALKVTNASEPSRALEFSRETQVETGKENGCWTIRVRYPQHRMINVSLWRLFKGDFDLPGVEVRLSLEVPKDLPIELDSASGDLESHGLAGSQKLQSVSGDIEAADATGRVSLATTSGDITASGLQEARVRSVSGDVDLDGVRGTLDVRTTSGGIEVKHASESLVLASVSGDIRVDGAPRGISASTTSGDLEVGGPAGGSVLLRSTSGQVRFGLERPLRSADASTLSGEIVVSLAAGLDCDLTLRSRSGALDSSVPLRVRTVSRHEMSGVVGAGGPKVQLNSTSGDITVTGGGS